MNGWVNLTPVFLSRSLLSFKFKLNTAIICDIDFVENFSDPGKLSFKV